MAKQVHTSGKGKVSGGAKVKRTKKRGAAGRNPFASLVKGGQHG